MSRPNATSCSSANFANPFTFAHVSRRLSSCGSRRSTIKPLPFFRTITKSGSKLCENSEVKLWRKVFVSNTLNKKRTALAGTAERRKERTQFCSLSTRARFHTACPDSRLVPRRSEMSRCSNKRRSRLYAQDRLTIGRRTVRCANGTSVAHFHHFKHLTPLSTSETNP